MNLTQPELESLAAILIRDLIANLKGKAIAGYLNAIRHGSTDIPPSSPWTVADIAWENDLEPLEDTA